MLLYSNQGIKPTWLLTKKGILAFRLTQESFHTKKRGVGVNHVPFNMDND